MFKQLTGKWLRSCQTEVGPCKPRNSEKKQKMKREKKPIIAFTKCCIVCKANLRQDSAAQILMANILFRLKLSLRDFYV